MTKLNKHKTSRIITIAVMVAVLLVAVYIMAHQIGLNPDLDFGAGAYYYADIPEYENTLDWDVYTPSLPYIFYVVVFLAWGVLMYLLWKLIDRK